MDGWNTTFLLGWLIFRGELLVAGNGLGIYGGDFPYETIIWDDLGGLVAVANNIIALICSVFSVRKAF